MRDREVRLVVAGKLGGCNAGRVVHRMADGRSPEPSALVKDDKRLVLALEDEAGVDQLHACGGQARCTTCRVEFLDGEPQTMTVAEKNVLQAKGVSGVRLSCQIVCDHDMSVRAISRLEGSGRKDAEVLEAMLDVVAEWIGRFA